MAHEGYRFECPNGHVHVNMRRTAKAKSRFYCNSCRKFGKNPHYDYIVDKKTGEEVTTRWGRQR